MDTCNVAIIAAMKCVCMHALGKCKINNQQQTGTDLCMLIACFARHTSFSIHICFLHNSCTVEPLLTDTPRLWTPMI